MMMKRIMTSKMGWWVVLLLGVALALCLLPMRAAHAASTTTGDSPITADGTHVTHQGDLTVVQYDGKPAITAENNANVTVTGNVTAGDSKTAGSTPGIQATNSTVTVDGNITTHGDKDSVGVWANGSTVNVGGNVTTIGSQNNDGVDALGGATVIVSGDISIRGYQATGVMAWDSAHVTANDIIVGDNGDAATGVHVWGDGTTVAVRDIVLNNPRDGIGIKATSGDAIVTANNVTTHSSQAIGVYVDDNASVIIDGSVLSTGKDAAGVELDFSGGKVRVGGNVSATQGYGAVVFLIPKNDPGYKGAATIVVEGTLSGGKAPIAIMPLSAISSMVYEYNENFDVSDYELPTIIVNQLKAGTQWVAIVKEDDKGEYVTVTGSKADAFSQAVLKSIYYIVNANGFTVAGAQNVTANGKTYLVAREGDTLTLTPIVGYGEKVASKNFGTYTYKLNGFGSYTITVANGGNLTFTATTAPIITAGYYSDNGLNRPVTHSVIATPTSSWGRQIGGIAFRIAGDMAKFEKVVVDGVVVDPKYYKITEGSTIVTFSPEYLAMLSTGRHRVAFVFEDGRTPEMSFAIGKDRSWTDIDPNKANGSLFTKTSATTNTTIAQTSDDTNAVAWAVVLAAAAAGIGAAMALRKKT